MTAERDLLAGFEACTWPRERWDHRAHLTVAWHYLREHGLDGAIEKMRAGIKRYNSAMGVPEGLDRGYHETMTIAWLRVLHAMMTSLGPEDCAAAFFDKQTFLFDKRLLLLFYSRDHIMSAEAKAHWVEPDLAPLPVARARARSQSG